MSAHTDAKLVLMANQIARNLMREDDPAAAVADHIRAFWSPSMIDRLRGQTSAALDPVAAEAMSRLETARG